MKHSWKETEVTEKDKKNGIKKKYVCQNGDCNCIREHRFCGISYERGMQIYSDAPECYGKTKLNDQKIDE